MGADAPTATATIVEQLTMLRALLPSPLTACIVGAYVSLSIFLNYYNAFLLGGGSNQLHLPDPVFYSFVQQIGIVVLTSLWCMCVPSVRFPVWATFRDNWMWLTFLSVFFSLSIASHNVAIGSISLTVVTIFKSAVPFPLMLFSACIENKRYTCTTICIVSVLVAGTLLAIPIPWDPEPPSLLPTGAPPRWVGYVLVILSTVATAMRPVISAHLMRTVEPSASRHPLSAVSMAWFDAAIAIPTLGVASLISDVFMRPGVQEVFDGDGAHDHVRYIIIGTVAAGLYAPITFYAIKLTSSLSFAIIGNFKQAVLLLGAALLVDHVTDPMLWAGVVIVILSSLAYSYQLSYEKRRALEQSQRDGTVSAKGRASEETPLKGG